MVKYMRSTVAFGIVVGNFIIASLNIFFSLMAINNNPKNYRILLETKERLLERNPNYFIKDILDKEIETPKELRNLSSKSLRFGLLITDACSYLFIIVLIISFWLTENECCNGDENIKEAFPIGSCNGKCECCGECNCNYFGQCTDIAPCELLLLLMRLFLLVPICLFVWIYFLIRPCGKHISRMVSVIALILINTTLVILSFLSGFDTYCILIAVCSFVSVIFNFLSILLPNLSNCKHLAYYIPEPALIDKQSDDDINREEINYPGPEEVVQDPFNKPATPSNIEQNQENDNDNDNRIPDDSLDAPLPEYLTQNNNDNNQVDIPYPSPE